MFRSFVLIIAVLLTGCVVKAEPVHPPTPCEDAKPLHVVIGVSAHNVPAATRRTVLQAVLQQLVAEIQPGSSGVVVSAYPLDDRSVSSQPLRTNILCMPPAPMPPDLHQAPTFQRATLLEAYRTAQTRSTAEVEHARGQLGQFWRELLALQPASAPTDIWGFLSVAADEFASVDASERVVIIVARDEEIQSTYCDGCHDLRGAAVYFLAFDQPTPADEQRRRSDWSMWLSRVGASSASFSRSNERLPALFPDPHMTAPVASVR
jgi:hypothetical protein